MKKLKELLHLFLTMFKIGLVTFGGGYAMVAIIERELVEKKRWLEHEEYMDVIAIAESTPGPLAINTSTYVGYKIKGVLGSVFATLGVVLPSFIIIFIISLFFDEFLKIEIVKYAFKGIQACVAFLILSAGLKMARHVKKTPLSIILLVSTIGCLVCFTLFAVNFSAIFFIIIGGVVGLVAYALSCVQQRRKKESSTPKDDVKGDE